MLLPLASTRARPHLANNMGLFSRADNFQAIYYGVFSDNRPDLALPYFPIIEQMVELGRWRAAVDWAPRAG